MTAVGPAGVVGAVGAVGARITVVGDALLDRDVVGTVARLCPDAPVPVLDATGELSRPGGAALAAALLSADGHDVTLLAPIGADAAGRALRALLAAHGVGLVALPTTGTTREKVRVRAGDQSLVRLDFGTPCPPAAELPSGAEQALLHADAVLVSDYAGGVTGHARLRSLLVDAVAGRPVVWDPHPRGAEPVAGVRLATPNQEEAARFAALAAPPSVALTAPAAGALTAPAAAALGAAHRHADALARRWGAQAVAVTLGARGALLSYGTGPPLVVPAPRCQALSALSNRDSCGAGDRFAATAVAALAHGELASRAVELAVATASAFVADGGAGRFAATVDRASDAGRGTGRDPGGETATGRDRVATVRARGGTVVATGGCFDLLHAGHVALLRAARDLGDALVVCLNSDASVSRLKGPGRPLVPQSDRVQVLEALEYVDAVEVFDDDTPDAVLRRLRPHVWAKGGDYALGDLPEAAALHEWGGQAVLLPYLDGRSTSGLIGAALTTSVATTSVATTSVATTSVATTEETS